MSGKMRMVMCWLVVALWAAGLPFDAAAKTYSSGGGRSYSSHSSSSSSRSSSASRSSSVGSSRSSSGSSTRSFSSGSSSRSSTVSPTRSSSSGSSSSSKSFSSSSGKSYSSGSTWSDSGRKSYTSGKSYTSSAGHTFSSFSDNPSPRKSTPLPSALRIEPGPSGSQLSFDAAAARAKQEEASKAAFTRFKEPEPSPPKLADAPAAASVDRPIPALPSPQAMASSRASAGSFQAAPVPSVPTATPSESSSYRVAPPPIPRPARVSPPPVIHVPDPGTLSTRAARSYDTFNPYSSRPTVVYHDPYNSLFWWWLLDRSLEERAWWTYHHREDMDPARYQALVATDRQLQARVEQLEAEQAPRDPNYTPPGLDRDLMYSDSYVAHTYSNRPTRAGVFAFWFIGIPAALAFCWLFIWLIWFKRWQVSN